MGGRAYPAPGIEGPERKLRAYVHAAGGSGKYTLLLINLADKPAFVSAPGRLRERYVLSPAGGFASKEILLNGEPVAEDLLYAWGRKKIRRKYGVSGDPDSRTEGSVTLPPYACAFLVCKA